MKLALLSFLGSVFVGAQNNPVWCVPGECRIDSNCADNIHPFITGRCCGGTCVRSSSVSSRPRLIGEQCAPTDLAHADNFEQCFATCAGGLFCNTVDERCHAKKGVGCPCLADRECLSSRCREGSHVCSGQNLPLGENCEENDECRSALCLNKKCSALAIGQSCSIFGGTPCVPEAICRRNSTFSATFCLNPCAAGEGDCCYSGSSACASTPTTNLVCNSGNYSCYAPAPVVYPGLNETCPSFECSNSTTMVCAYQCNGAGCDFTRVCQLRNQLAVGTPCDQIHNAGQCVVGSTCEYSFANATYLCTTPPSFAPTGSPTSAPTALLNSVPLGQPCGAPRNFNLCMAPGNICERNETGDYVCKQSGTTPVGAFCAISSLSVEVRALDECVKGSRCTRNASFGGTYACRAAIPVGQRCYVNSNNYRDYDFPECENGWDNCELTGRSCSGCDSNDINGNPCCTCVAPRTVADGMNCSASSQCQKATSLCLSENYTCVNIQGIDCITQADCKDSRFDCNCDRKCYLLNAPTPSRTSLAPTASTRAPSTYTSRCDAQKKAWEASSSYDYDVFPNYPYLYYSNFHTEFVPKTLQLPQADQALLIAYVCCETCPMNSRFNSHIYGGYQVDCGAKKLIKLDDTCNDLRGTWALANCWGALSAAPSLDIGLGAFVGSLLLFLF